MLAGSITLAADGYGEDQQQKRSGATVQGTHDILRVAEAGAGPDAPVKSGDRYLGQNETAGSLVSPRERPPHTVLRIAFPPGIVLREASPGGDLALSLSRSSGMRRPQSRDGSLRRWRGGAAGLALTAALHGCAGAPAVLLEAEPPPTPRPEALSLLNRPLYRPALPPSREAQLQAELDSAARRYMDDPDDADAVIWLGRRLGYLGRYREAITVFTAALEKHPQDARILRHRGHRYLTTRQLDLAVADLARAAELVQGQPDAVEPDGQPNAANVPTSTLQGNIYYHLALAQYLRGDFESARQAWEQALAVATTDDMRVAVVDWLYLTNRRLGRTAEAQRLLALLDRDLTILENEAYLRRLRLYRGMLPPDSLQAVASGDPVQAATYGYGLAIWHLLEGDTTRARTLLQRVVRGSNWAAFGYLAAEAELAAWRERTRAPRSEGTP